MRNPFVYNTIEAEKLSVPFFEVYLPEIYSQCGEDLIILGILEAYAIRHELNLQDFKYLELGANHPVATSSTYLFYKKYEMSGVLVEANPNLIVELEKERPRDKILNIALTNDECDEITLFVPQASELATINKSFLETWPAEGADNIQQVQVKALRINKLLEQEFSTGAPQLLVIDIEGFDFEILQDMDLIIYRPYIIQIEYSEHFITDNIKRITRHLTQRSYFLVAKTDVNLIFVDRMS